jgi:hypothetical protein
MNLGYEDTMTEIYSVDSQYSKDGGVVVQVTGALQAKGKDRRPFVQTFFLAVQEKGYFVLNDIFRYLLPPGVISGMLDGDEGTKQIEVDGDGASASESTTTTTTPEKSKEESTSTSPKLDMEGLKISDTATTTEATPSPSPAASPLEAARAAAAAATVPSVAKYDKDATTTTTTITKDLQRQTSGGPSAVPAAPGVTVPFGPLVPGEVEGGTAGVNGVSIVYGAPRLSDNSDRQGSLEDEDTATTSPTSSTTPNAAAAAAAALTTRPPPPPPRPEGSTSVSVSSIKSADSPEHDSMEPPPAEGVFIRDIPQAVTVEQLAEALTRFGPIVEGTLALKTQQNRDSYAFVDYESAEDAAECLAHGMEFFGKKVRVETKRPHIFKSSGGGGGGMRNNNAASHNINSLGGLAGLHYPTSPMQMQYPASPMHLHQQQQYHQQYQREQQQQHAMQHNARVSNGAGGILSGASTGGYTTQNRQHMSNGRNSGGGNPQMQMHQRNNMPMQNAAAAYQMAAAGGGYPVMMYNPAMSGMTYVQLPPNQAAAMMMVQQQQQQQDPTGGAVGLMDGVYGSFGGGMQMGNRGGRGGGGNPGNGRYDSSTGGGRGGGGRGGGSGSGGQQRGSSSDQHSPYGRAALGQSMPYV